MLFTISALTSTNQSINPIPAWLSCLFLPLKKSCLFLVMGCIFSSIFLSLCYIPTSNFKKYLCFFFSIGLGPEIIKSRRAFNMCLHVHTNYLIDSRISRCGPKFPEFICFYSLFMSLSLCCVWEVLDICWIRLDSIFPQVYICQSIIGSCCFLVFSQARGLCEVH